MERYGLILPDNANDLTVEQIAFRDYKLIPEPTRDRFDHLRDVIDTIWTRRKLWEWNPWAESMLQACCDHQYVAVTGPAASAKTTSAAMYALNFWACAPSTTAVILTSTTLDGLKRRVWKEVTRFYNSGLAGVGNPVMSRTKIQFEKGVDAAGLYGIPVEEGSIEKAVSRIIGFHVPRILVVMDEGTDMTDAIVEACVNLSTGCQEFQFLILGNAKSRLDPHGKMCEPAAGWASVSVEDEMWPTKRGICLHFDGLKSPNITVGERWPYLLRQQDLDATIRDYGENSPQFWRMRRGFWPPEGIENTVITESTLIAKHAFDKAEWEGPTVTCAGLDPAFAGGNKCALRFARRGKFTNGTLGIGLEDKVTITPDTTSKVPVHYQIARKVMAECKARGVEPREFAMDATGEGGGVADILSMEWSPGFRRVEFGGRPSEMPVSPENPKKAVDEYVNKVTELWFSFRWFVWEERIRGLDSETARQFCAREKTEEGKKVAVEPKKKMKERTSGESPDDADAVAVLVDLCRSRGMVAKGRLPEKGSDRYAVARAYDVDAHSGY